MTIQKTTNYSLFKVLEGNRSLNSGHLARLTMSIAKKNLLEYSPILVNENMEVIDGQHRLEVAKQNKLSIFYMIIPTAGLNEVLEINTNLRNWNITDLVDSLIIQGNKTMQYLRDFCDEYELSITQGILFHTGRAGGSHGNRTAYMSRMTFTDAQKELALKAADLCYDVKQLVNRRGMLPHSVAIACRKVTQEGNDKKISDAVKSRGKIISISLDHDEMYRILMGYLKK